MLLILFEYFVLLTHHFNITWICGCPAPCRNKSNPVDVYEASERISRVKIKTRYRLYGRRTENKIT